MQDPRAGILYRRREVLTPGRGHAYPFRVVPVTKAIAKSTAKPWKSYRQRPHVETESRLSGFDAVLRLPVPIFVYMQLWMGYIYYVYSPEQNRDDYTRRI